MRKQTGFTLSILLLPFFFGAIRATAQEPLIIESEEGGQNTEFYEEVLGVWGHSESKSKAEGLSDVSIGSRYVQFSTPPHEAEVHFKPVLPQEGYYRVSITWGRSGNVKNAKFIVEAPPDINKTIYMDQDGGGGTGSPNGDRWNSLGIFKLPTEGTVVKIVGDEVTDITTQGYNFRIYADAVKFEPVSESEALKPEPTGKPAAAPPQSAPFSSASSVAPAAPSSPFVSGAASAAPAQPAATVSSPFGATTTRPAAPATASSPFGAPPAAGPATASSPFGAPPAAAPAAATSSSPFVGQPASTTSSSPFPAAPAAPAAASASPFGAPPASVASAPPAPTGSTFGAPTASTGTSSPFPAAPAAPSASMSNSPFPAAPAASSASTSPFGAPPSTSQFGPPAPSAPASAFAAPPPSAPASSFAAAPPSAPSSSVVFAPPPPPAPTAVPPTPMPTTPPVAAVVMEPQPPLIQLKWLEYPEALIEGKKAHRPILLHFHSNIGPAKKFHDEVLSDPNVQLEMQRFVLARIYMQDQQDLVKYYHVERAPTLIFLGPDGYTRLRIDGPVAAEPLAARLAKQR